jgi:hypothetical protein
MVMCECANMQITIRTAYGGKNSQYAHLEICKCPGDSMWFRREFPLMYQYSHKQVCKWKLSRPLAVGKQWSLKTECY